MPLLQVLSMQQLDACPASAALVCPVRLAALLSTRCQAPTHLHMLAHVGLLWTDAVNLEQRDEGPAQRLWTGKGGPQGVGADS